MPCRCNRVGCQSFTYLSSSWIGFRVRVSVRVRVGVATLSPPSPLASRANVDCTSKHVSTPSSLRTPLPYPLPILFSFPSSSLSILSMPSCRRPSFTSTCCHKQCPLAAPHSSYLPVCTTLCVVCFYKRRHLYSAFIFAVCFVNTSCSCVVRC